ncbi:hypothetical protein TNCV_4780081 [Trichonephila clavipes]|nr:hypothetical protein TNCV_4780081 [Trichonephila clavipes]
MLLSAFSSMEVFCYYCESGLKNGCGNDSLVIKVTQSSPECLEFEPRTAEVPPSEEADARYVEAQMSSRWLGGEVRRGVLAQVAFSALIIVQKYKVCRQKPPSS